MADGLTRFLAVFGRSTGSMRCTSALNGGSNPSCAINQDVANGSAAGGVDLKGCLNCFRHPFRRMGALPPA